MLPHRFLESLLIVLLLILVSFVPISPPGTARAEPQRQSAPEMSGSVLIALNQWRISEGLWPLRPNATLEALALEQALYLQGLGETLPYDRIHDGPDGSDPPTRARRAGWPSYGRDEFIVITEIAKVGPDAHDAMTFWTTSSVHLRAISNPIYREIGIAAVRHEFGYITIVMLGARPDVLPAMLNAAGNTLYLSNERYRGSSGFRYLTNATQVRVFDGSGRPLQDSWLAWQPSLPLPPGIGGPLVIAYSDGTRQTVAVVDLPAGSTPALAAAIASPAPAGPTLAPTSMPLALQAASPQPAASSTRAAATPVPPVPAAASAPPDTRVVYDARSLVLVNISDTRQDWSTLAVVQGDRQLTALRWNNLGGFTVSSVPPRTCLIAIDPVLAASAPPPDFCTSYYAELELGINERFWANGVFEVQIGGRRVASCAAPQGICEFALP